MSSSPKEATTDTPNANNKRALSSEPDAVQDNSKRANTKTEDENADKSDVSRRVS